MNKYFIYEYIKKLSLDDVRRLASSWDIYLSDKEVVDVYNYIKSNWQKYFNGYIGVDDIIIDASSILSGDNYKKVYKLYLKYKENN